MTAIKSLRSIPFLLTLVLSLTLTSCRDTTPEHQPETTRPAPAMVQPVMSSPEIDVPLTDESLYQIGVTWSDQNGRSVQLASLRGKPVVISMVFTRCAWACPMIVQDMKKIAARLPDDVKDRVHYVLVTLDPARDTPDVLAEFARTHHLDATQWTLLRGTASDVRLLAALLGTRYREEANGQFSHTNMISILNEEGEIVHVQEGLGSDPTGSVDKLRNLFAANS